MTYFDELAAHLRDRGVPADEIASTVDDLAAYIAESGADPVEEFGPAAGFADELAGDGRTSAGPSPDAEIWHFHADAFNEVRRLNEFGDQGWELDRYDTKLGFTCRRDVERPQRWEYRREIVPTLRRKAAAERLAPDGWELAVAWTVWMYFKRPKSASVGPAGELDTTPEAPARYFFWSRSFYVFVAVYAALFTGAVLAWAALSGDIGMAMGFMTGALIAGIAIVVPMARARRRARPRPPRH
ncbi:hypothetical protein [Actinomadura rudentiformis]|uniref:hypothetical protein n=1 Tax=Actinomadura rudentiformis TaxID=359158 RepID=UPI00178C5F50|nr:hypothetical protein [Actinomadura rudentiformis]